MGVSVSGSGGGGRRRPAADLNLVPYVDLLTCMVSFLLITAVWTQVTGLEARRGPGPGGEPGPPLVRLAVLVNAEGFNVIADQQREMLPRRSGSYDMTALATAMRRIKAAYPDRSDVVLASEDSVSYDTIVGAMDTLIGAGFPEVALAAAAEGP